MLPTPSPTPLARARRSPARAAAGVDQRFAVDFDYPVSFTEAMFAPGNRTLVEAVARREPGRRHRVSVVIDGGVATAWPGLHEAIHRYCSAHADTLELVDSPLIVPGGEPAKNDPVLVEALLRRFFAQRLDRHACVLIIGGGAVLDAVGYAAAIAHRGLRVVRVPTTVLAQNDAGVGVKNGVNRFGSKNALGCFAPPFAVINDAAFISTLKTRDRTAGIAEAVKVALIRDREFFLKLEADADALASGESRATRHMIQRCAELHLAHIRGSGDAFEYGSARPLDFGHWAAHKLEVLSAHGLVHGEAVSIGIAIDCRYSARVGLLAPEDAARVERTLAAIGLPLWHPALDRRGPSGGLEVLDGLEEFREHLGGELTVTMLRALGVGVEVHQVDRDHMAGAIAELRMERAG